MYYIEFKEVNSEVLGIAVASRPNIPAPQKRGTFVEVAGRDGTLFVTDGTYENISFSIDMNFVRASIWWQEAYRTARNWLTGSGKLRLSDNHNWHYKVITCGITNVKRRGRMGADITATFECEPFQYHDGGETKMSVEEVLNNPYYLCKPTYYITGTGQCTLTVNDKSVTANVYDSVVIDTDKMIAYKDDTRTTLVGDYEDLWLPNGLNEITITDGFMLEVEPHWRSL